MIVEKCACDTGPSIAIFSLSLALTRTQLALFLSLPSDSHTQSQQHIALDVFLMLYAGEEAIGVRQHRGGGRHIHGKADRRRSSLPVRALRVDVSFSSWGSFPCPF